ncbi:MAG: pyridoxal-phosphate dependent enzyme, partial [Deltaproteobacteria bacterium]|nr:pyridoxal-phosphate dependent enzyme [Deltaproteobacteria bacterium]
FINYFASKNKLDNLLAICASTGDTSASAALYASYLADLVKSAVLLPHGKVTPQQLAQPLGSGAKVLEIPGVFDDCMKVVEALADNYHVALLNSKNSWRILGQESFSYEISQDFDYEVADKVIVLPIGNAGNITAIMNGFLKFFQAGITDGLPKIIGVQSEHMIGNPVSMPRVIKLFQEYNNAADDLKIFIVQVTEQDIMDSMIIANRNGNIVCTQGGESLAGLKKAKTEGFILNNETCILDSTAHMLKFLTFQEMYFEDSFPPEFKIKPKNEFKNAPVLVRPENLKNYPERGRPLKGEELQKYIHEMSAEIAGILGLKAK